MNQFTHADDYEIRRVTGKRPKADTTEGPPATHQKKKHAKKAEQTSVDFASAPKQGGAHDGEEV